MNCSIFAKATLSLAAGTVVLLTAMQAADAADRVRISGTVESLNGDTLMIKNLDSKEIKVMLKPGMNVMGIKKASAADIKPGDFVGIGSQPTPSGINGAVQVVIFPASMKGTGEGDRAWNVTPNGTMTNATVADAVEDVNGPVLTLAYQGGQRKISIPDDTTIVAISPATKEDLKAGAAVSVQGVSSGNHMMDADAVRVGLAGATPPR
ncbi:hypothetical protein EPK99_24835 [Neorhizobium lilium]|uniref:DUF5666 domain-containing protein n=1 Tax=Neorhizobium lilium TaxID=2503024 RepID=A0A444LA20_9HYPH|nr:hypothetical protein [Neorhizobium lilium]RWX74414.1 hypothetical protein EPK99_24835 [Neorhizobium lilium]